jgi:hypothetical protein
MRDAFLGDDRAQGPADPERDLDARSSPTSSEKFVTRGPIAKNRRVAAVCLLPPRLDLPTTRLVTLIWVLFLWQAMTAESLAGREEAPPPDGPVGVTTDVRPTSSCPLAKIRTCRRTSVALHFPRPRLYLNDDEATDNRTDDDDDWEDLSFDDNSSEPVIAWFPEVVCFLTFHEVSRAPAWPEIPSSPFLPPQRLRC